MKQEHALRNKLESDAESPATSDKSDGGLQPNGAERDIRDRQVPIKYLVDHQLQLVGCESLWAGDERRSRLRDGTRALHASLDPTDAVDTMLTAIMVGLHNLTMTSMHRAGYGAEGPGREMAFRYAVKGAKAFAELSKFYDARRGRGSRKVTVGTVNVEQGGKAIVGNVDTAVVDRRDPKEQTMKPKIDRLLVGARRSS